MQTKEVKNILKNGLKVPSCELKPTAWTKLSLKLNLLTAKQASKNRLKLCNLDCVTIYKPGKLSPAATGWISSLKTNFYK